MAEEAQEVVVEHTGQPLVCEIEVAVTDETADGTYATTPTNVTVEIDPASD